MKFTKISEDQVGRMVPTDMVKHPAIEKLIADVGGDPEFSHLIALAHQENNKRFAYGGINATIDASVYSLLDSDLDHRFRNLPAYARKRAVRIQANIHKRYGLRGGLPYSPLANYLVDGGSDYEK